LAVGLFFLLVEKSIGFAILFFLAVLWLILDNPLENFVTLGDQNSSEANVQFHEGDEILPDFSQSEAVEVGLGDTLDLHTFLPKDVPSLVDEFIRVSQADGLLHVKIVHGKGTGALRRRVHGLLAHDPRVANFYTASPKSGGWGATVVELRPGKELEGKGDR
jgi:DNA-nicking Smr family endonuclease